MLSRRDFLIRSLQGSSLLALGPTIPGFLASTAQAAEHGKDKILVVLELTGGNDGLNTVVPFDDDLYHKARPTLGLKKEDVITIDDRIGLNPALRGLESLLENDQLAVVQGVGYPNPNRSHFESMDIWHTADPRRELTNGWLGRSLSDLEVASGRIPAFHVGEGELPLALEGSAAGVPSLNPDKPFGLDLGDEFYGHRPGKQSAGDQGAKAVPLPTSTEAQADKPESKPQADKSPPGRMQAVRQLAEAESGDAGDMLSFVRRTAVDTYTSIDRLQEIMGRDFQVPEGDYQFVSGDYRQVRRGLRYELTLIAEMIAAGFGTRVFYVSIGGFDTHSGQRETHNELLEKVATAVSAFFSRLETSGDADRVVLTTFSEFGRRVRENGSQGTDHGAGSCMFVAGPAVKGGPVGEHPSLAPDELERGDLKFHTDFRQVYATLLDQWLGCDSRRVLGGPFEHVPLFGESA